jgi:hypothetical protein
MRHLSASIFTVFMLAAPSAAFAQLAPTTGPQGQPGQPSQRQEPGIRPPAAIAGENYLPLGVPVGSFRLYPVLELDESFNDNIYAVSTASGKTGSFIQGIRPGVSLRSNWNEHMLNLYGTGNFGLYSVDNNNNYYDGGGGFDGRYDIQRDWNVYGGGSFYHLHEDRGTPTSVSPTIQPNQYNQIDGSLGYFQKFNRFSARLEGHVDNYNYTNEGLGPAAGSILNSDRDRTEVRESLRLGWDFSPAITAWVRGSLNQRAYVNTPDSLGFAHNSNGFDVVGGLVIDLGGITFLEFFGGYIQQTYVDPRFPQVSAPTFGLTAYWNPYRPLWVKPFVRRTVEDSPLVGTSAYINTSGGVDVDYGFLPNVQISGHADFSTADYNAVFGTPNRSDQYLTLRIGFKYLPTRNFFVGPSYQYVNRWSNIAGGSYDQNLIMLRLGAQL